MSPSEQASDLNPIIYFNGNFVRARDAAISVFDHGFLYGDGAFEGIRIDNGGIFRLREHVARLFMSLHYLRIPMILTQEEVAEAVKETARRNDLADGYLRPLVTRGVGPLGIETSKSISEPTFVIIPQARRKFDDEVRTKTGLKAKVVSVRRTPSESVDSRIKSCNYINNILGKFEQWDAGADAGIMLSTDGYVSEGCSENIFCVSQGSVKTPPVTRVLDGITRRAVMQLAHDRGYAVSETDLTVYDLYNADEVFVTGTLTEVVPLTTIDGRKIGDGTAGPITRTLLAALRELMAEEAEVALGGKSEAVPSGGSA